MSWGSQPDDVGKYSYYWLIEFLQADEESLEEDLVAEQETAGFHDPPQRRAYAGHFNHLLLWSVLREGAGSSKP